jgi:hypothetical protein
MSSRKYRSNLHDLLFFPVILVILGAFAVSIASVVENLRFVRGTFQLSDFVGKVRAFIQEHPTYSLKPGQDVWVSMVQAGQISSTAPQNPWSGDIRAWALSATQIRIETELPSQACRRIASSLLKMNELDLLSIEAQPERNGAWYTLYPAPSPDEDSTITTFCGTKRRALLAMVYKIK